MSGRDAGMKQNYLTPQDDPVLAKLWNNVHDAVYDDYDDPPFPPPTAPAKTLEQLANDHRRRVEAERYLGLSDIGWYMVEYVAEIIMQVQDWLSRLRRKL